MRFPWSKKKEETNNTETIHWEENPLYEYEPQQEHQRASANPMNDYLQDMKNSKTRHHLSPIRFFSKKDSKEYTDVKNALSDVTECTNKNFVNDAEINTNIMNQAAKGYHRLVRACHTYLEKGGGKSESGHARKEKVRQILELAMQDYETVKTLSYNIRSMSVEEQAGLNWQDILSKARTVNLEVEPLSSYRSLGANMKTGENVSKLLPEHGVFTKENILNVADLDNPEGKDYTALQDYKDISFHEKGSLTVDNVGSKLNLTARNVATSRVANLLGIGGIVAQSKTVKIKEKSTGNITKGNLMELAKGVSGASIAAGSIYEDMKKINNIQERIEKANNHFAPTVQKELSSLQVLDFICGQTDRHANNFFVEKNGEQYSQIKGIDNDMAFGTGVDLAEIVKSTGDYERKRNLRMVADAEGNLAIPHMDKQLALNVINLKKEELEFALEDLITPAFIDAAVKRLEIVQNAIRKELSKTNSNVLIENESDWNLNTHKDFIYSTGNMKMLQEHEETKGNQAYFDDPGFLDNINKQYEKFRQNNYYGEYMLSVMGYDFHSRRFERE